MLDSKEGIKKLLEKKVLVLDGATGTQLQKRGMPQGVCPEKWCLDNSDLLGGVHSDYQRSGSDIVYASTFGANRFKLGEYNIGNVEEVNKELVRIAKKSVGRKALVAGDIGPTGQLVKPFGNLDFEEAIQTYKEQVKGLLAGGVDLFVIETMLDIQEARAALIAVKELCDKFTIVTMTYEEGGRTLNGTDPLTALVTLQSLGADAIGCNCSTGPEQMLEFIKAMKPAAGVPLVAKPNAGIPKLIDNKTVFDMGPSEFASFANELIGAGVNMLGGCCGTTPEHINEVKKKISGVKPIIPVRASISAISSARETVVLSKEGAISIIGEKINPTGKKKFQGELTQGKFSYIRQQALEQQKWGAKLLDVNVGAPGIDEEKTMLAVIELLVTITGLPLVIDSSNIAVIEKALRFYPGRALINSISAEKEKLKKLLPLVKKYGAMFIALPLGDKEMPRLFKRRKQIIEHIFKEAAKFGFGKDDIVVDGMVMTVSSDSSAPEQTLKTIEWCSQVLDCNTIIGLSNVSFGLPQRKIVNATFLAMAQEKGLSMVIADPCGLEPITDKWALDLLTGKDKDARNFIDHFKEEAGEVKKEKKEEIISIEDRISRAILEGNREDIQMLVKEAIDSGYMPYGLINDIMIPTITKVGELFDKKEYFLPQLIASAETMKEGFEYIQTFLTEEEGEKREIILLATVKGDIHDIGKNIVALMLKNHGFKVIDLGKDVSAEKIIEEIKKHNPLIVGLSALMTTTMVNMKEVVELAKKERQDVKFIVGGAVVTRNYAQSIDADYAKDGVEAVKVVKKLINSN
jgi:5-methyltetrahydrofolate--homocysteine methyltransferase